MQSYGWRETFLCDIGKMTNIEMWTWIINLLVDFNLNQKRTVKIN